MDIELSDITHALAAARPDEIKEFVLAWQKAIYSNRKGTLIRLTEEEARALRDLADRTDPTR